jgi:hypothetical protein
MFVVLDTNAIFEDFYLTGRALTQLLDHARRGRFTVCLPYVVVREMVKHYGEKVDTLNTRRREASELARQLKLGEVEFVPVVREDAVPRYEEAFGALLQQLQIEVLPLPNQAMESLLERGLWRRRPLTQRGDGLPDALTWETIVALTQEHPLRQVAFISRDEDFSEKVKGTDQVKLHPELLKELPGTLVTASAVTDGGGVPLIPEQAALVELHRDIRTFLEDWEKRTGTAAS